MINRTRSLLGIILFLPLAALLLTLLACLPAPVGDPETAKVDAKLSGAWQNDDGTLLALIRPWDTHTYYITYIMKQKNAETEKVSMMPFKAWLTPLGGATFLTAEPLNKLDYAFGQKDDEKPYWIVGKLELKENALVFRPVKTDSWIVKGLDTREKLEAAIKAQANNDELYGDTMTFKKLQKADARTVEDAMKTLHLGEN